jgi:hypothetical protein
MTMALAALRWSLTAAAERLGVGRATLQRILASDEGFDKARPEILKKVWAGLVAEGAEFRADGSVLMRRGTKS